MSALYGAAAVISAVRSISDTPAALRITGGEMFPDLGGNAVCRAELCAYADGSSPEICLSVLASFTARVMTHRAEEGILRISPISTAAADGHESGYFRFCQRFEVIYKGGL